MPGGNYLEGNTIGERYQWKQTIGPIEKRPGYPGTWVIAPMTAWGCWCQDLHMQPFRAVWAGYSLDGTHVNPGADVQDALDEIQDITVGLTLPGGVHAGS